MFDTVSYDTERGEPRSLAEQLVGRRLAVGETEESVMAEAREALEAFLSMCS